jgi:hypothetical protein
MMSRRWPWFVFLYGFVWWPICWEGWAVVFGLWALVGGTILLKPYIPANSSYVVAEVAVILGYMFFAGSKTDFPRWPKP